jgi:hypothetical protein
MRCGLFLSFEPQPLKETAVRHTASQPARDTSPKSAQEPRRGERSESHVSRILTLLELHGPMKLSEIVDITGINLDVASVTVGRLRKTGRVAIDDPSASLQSNFDARSEPRGPNRRYRFVQRQIEGREERPPGRVRPVRRNEAEDSRAEQITLSLSKIERIMAPTLKATVARLKSVSSQRVYLLLARGEDPMYPWPPRPTPARPVAEWTWPDA